MTLAGGICGALFDRQRTGQRPPRVDEPAARRPLLRRLGPRRAAAARQAAGHPARGRRSRSRSSTATRRPTTRASGCSASRATATGRASSRRSSVPTWPPTSASPTPGPGPPTRAAVIAELDVAFGARPMAEWVARFDEHDVWWAPINTPTSALEDPQVAASGAFVEMTTPDGAETYRAIASPVDIDRRPQRPGPSPDARRAHGRGPRRARLQRRGRRDALLTERRSAELAVGAGDDVGAVAREVGRRRVAEALGAGELVVRSVGGGERAGGRCGPSPRASRRPSRGAARRSTRRGRARTARGRRGRRRG